MHKLELDYHNHNITLETGRLAKQADGSVLAQYGNTHVLVTAVASKSNSNSLGYFPLTCTYLLKTYALGKIPGGFFKREARPSDTETLISRMIDRPIRPLFPKAFQAETQIVATVLNYDENFSPEIPAIMGASAALLISDIPYTKPIAAAYVGYDGTNYILNPNAEARLTSQLSLLVVASKDAILMVESEANELSEEIMLGALDFGHKSIQPLITLQEELVKKAGRPKRVVTETLLDQAVADKLKKLVEAPLAAAIDIKTKIERYNKLDEVKALVKENFATEIETHGELIFECFDKIKAQMMRKMILDKNERVDGRKSDEIRTIACEKSFLPNVHGSALFTRGETQALVTATLGSKDDEQLIDEPPKAYYKRFYLHYNFPSYSVGEARRMGPPGRREIGHGRLAERALSKVLPDHAEFPYTIRIVSEILESNGSSSMASVCGATLALQCAEVPITAPVAGIAMGLVYSDQKSVILSDILGDEDHVGDMDFKVAGTAKGITALQMDIKIDGLSIELLEKALTQAKSGRIHILGEMDKVVDKHNKSEAITIPRFLKFKIPVSKIRVVIGSGGSVIKAITAETDTKIDISDSGMINIVSSNKANAERAMAIIQQKIGLLQIGQTYQGIIKSKRPIGFFVQCLPDVDGLVALADIENPDQYNEGDTMAVLVTGYDKRERLQLSVVK